RRTEPLRRPMRPMIARIVLVRPAPLRPRSVTTSPSSTCRFTPCSTCDSPYQPCRSLISRKRLAMVSASAEPPRGGRAPRRGPWGKKEATWGLSSMCSCQLDVGAAHVGLDHRRVLRHLLVRPFGQRRAALQHGDRVGDAPDDAHVVLDHQHGAVGSYALDEVL